VEHIALSGHAGAFPLTADAKQLLVTYLADARSSLGADADADETVRDIGTSIGDELRHTLDGGPDEIDVIVMSRILTDAGPVETGQASRDGRAPWLCRVQQRKWFGGLCLGLATRSDLRVDWVRTFAIFFLLITGGLLGVAYLVSLLFVPRIETVEQYKALIAQDKRAGRSQRAPRTPVDE